MQPFFYSIEEQKQIENEIVENSKQLRIKLAKEEAILKGIEKLLRRTYFFLFLCVAGLFIGFKMSKWGFENWYEKIQVIQDRELQKRLKISDRKNLLYKNKIYNQRSKLR